MVLEKNPLFVETDEAGNVTNFAQFVSGVDVIPQELGGTGATSVSGLGSSILVGELASGVSGAAQEAVGLVFNPTTGDITPEAGMAQLNLTGKQVVTTNFTVKAASFTVNGTQCPIPLPFGYMQLDSDGTDTTASALVGAGATVTNIVSDSDDITWNDTNKQFQVSAAGTYECLGNITFEGGATLVLVTINKSSVPVLSVTPRVHSTVDPVERTVRAIFTAVAGDTVDIGYDAQSGNSVKPITGSTISLKRLK
jgi:hypothetical protein